MEDRAGTKKVGMESNFAQSYKRYKVVERNSYILMRRDA